MRKKLFFTLSILIFMVAASPAPAEPRDIAIGWLMIMDWDADFPEAPTCLRDHSDRPTDWTITFEAIFFDQLLSGEQVITDYNMVVTTGHEYYAFTADERAILESYLDAGGTLWFDDCANIEADNLPYDYEIDFGRGEYTYWGLCYGDCFTIEVPGHPLLNAVYPITAPMIRNDPGLNDSQWFTPPYDWDSRYTVIITGTDMSSYGYSGPFLMAARVSNGKIAASFCDTTCAMECIGYGNDGIPLYDYYWVLNLLAWVDSDGDNIEDWMEGAFEGAPATTPVDTDEDTISDYLDVDTDGDGVLDIVEAGDDDLDTPPVDSDEDGTPDFRDTDSDNDTILDGEEERADADGDGHPDADADGDTIPNRIDPDSDNDGKPDIDEGTGDIDGDGIANFVDADDYDGPAFREDGGMEEDIAEEIPDAAPDGGTDALADLPEDPSYDPAGDTTYPDTSFDAITPDSPADSFDEGFHADTSEGCGCVMAR